MLLLFLLFTTCYAAPLEYNMTMYYYNNNQCYNIANTTASQIVSNCDTLNTCVPYTNYSVYKTCELILPNYNGFTVLITLLVTFLFFILYKSCCQIYLDNVCLLLKDIITSICCPNRYETSYNSL
jgi:hypothetical protein